ncbi:MAG: 3-phosphoshikimate 1-carboxyvinyltransferase [Alphaproteobacteria bacterium]|nr:3-phosphoshikimate 1-carboxyvinyltransferase [Alphaproteobacteria bacterium]MBT5158900.1 3-phosphoshikimate 1-carboxyvinyltransferase [Alphaproteobacteria bacterium]MBT5918905.1 3-phosphoshikimate 1-carboxyvinyltransferase [Alphaproteobacteria bacterium]MBT6387153.1 3-phosphoshikimate 1-carboxyvinyltransferase [Alphaproteobacteria bacterium]
MDISVHPLTSRNTSPLTGTVIVPGDKSISHRALIFGAMSIGETRITGLSQGEDVQDTASALVAMGAGITTQDGVCLVEGRGIGGLMEPATAVDLGNSGTAVRLLMGVAAQQPIKVHFTGDASLSSRPMARVMTPLKQLGIQFDARDDDLLPLSVQGPEKLLPIRYTLPVPSAQVKSAILLAGLAAPGETAVIEKERTRDHTERMVTYFGGDIHSETGGKGEHIITVKGQPELKAAPVDVPGDPSQAAFVVVAALLCPDSDVTVRNVCLNTLRDGLFVTLREMGANLEYLDERNNGGEPVADIRVRSSQLHGIEVPADRAPSMIDEYPVLCIAAAFATGQTVMKGLAELRVKESDRLAVMAEGLKACGIKVAEQPDGLIIDGGTSAPGGATVATHLDHRIAMSFLVLGLVSDQPVTVDDGSPIDTSFPGFADLFNGLGADISNVERKAS